MIKKTGKGPSPIYAPPGIAGLYSDWSGKSLENK